MFNGFFRLLFFRFDDVLNLLLLDVFEFLLLGLGDVVIFGLLVVFMLCYDVLCVIDLCGCVNVVVDVFMEIFVIECDVLEVGVENWFDGDGDGDFEVDGYRFGIGKCVGDVVVFVYDEVGDMSGGIIFILLLLSGCVFFSVLLFVYLIGLFVAIFANLFIGEG